MIAVQGLIAAAQRIIKSPLFGFAKSARLPLILNCWIANLAAMPFTCR